MGDVRGVTKTTRTMIRSGTEHVPILDRSRSRLRLPVELFPEALRQASGEGLASPLATVRMETGRVITGGRIDPVAAEMLQVISSASMTVAVDVERFGDASLTTIWATPIRAVVTSSLNPDLLDVEPVRMGRLPETLTDAIVLGRPKTTADRSIEVSKLVMAELERLHDDPERSATVLANTGLDDEDVGRVMTFRSPSTRRWRISSTWATDDGQRKAELEGLDAEAKGQWLVERTGNDNEPGIVTFTPQGDGDILPRLA